VQGVCLCQVPALATESGSGGVANFDLMDMCDVHFIGKNYWCREVLMHTYVYWLCIGSRGE
jgi:hypothetical protein